MMKNEAKALTQLQQLDDFVERTAKTMKTRVHQKHAEGRRGWRTNVNDLLERFDRATRRKDYLDASILAAMLYDYQQRNSQRKTEART